MSAVRGIFPAGEERAFRACSACAGDYEDPEKGAWYPEQTDDEDDGPELRASASDRVAASMMKAGVGMSPSPTQSGSTFLRSRP